MARVLVTGAGGFLGAHIARALSKHGFDMIRAGRSVRDGIDLAADLSLPKGASELLRQAQPDVVVHAAGRRHGTPEQLEAANLATTRNLVAAATAVERKPVVLVLGSAAEYGTRPSPEPIAESGDCRPASAYARSKLAATEAALEIAHAAGLRLCVLRPFNVVGAGMGGLPGDAAAWLNGEAHRIEWARDAASLGMVRDFVAVGDLAEACRRAIGAPSVPPILNVCSGVGRSFASLLDEMAALSGQNLGRPKAPGAGDWSVGDPSLLRATLGFVPSATLSDSLAAAIAAGGQA